MAKIFGIGLPKSGTSSLHEALVCLGYRSWHNPADKSTERDIRTANYKLSILDKFDALSDVPVPAIFPQLDKAWPDSKFILTVRNIDQWIESSRKAGFNQAYATPKPGTVVEFYRTLLFGCNVFHEDRYRWIFESYHKLVRDYFSGEKEKQLLILDFSKEVRWNELCDFLNKPIPNYPFPHANPYSARKELTDGQKIVISSLVKLGVPYRSLRKWGNKIRRKK